MAIGGDSEVEVNFTATTGDFNSRVQELNSAFRNFDSGVSTSKNSLASMSSGMNLAEHATAGVTREIIVLGHEMVSGNFSRIPGSLMVLAERFGGLSLGVLGIGAAIGAAGYALYEYEKRAAAAAAETQTLESVMAALGKDGFVNADTLNSEIDRLSKLKGATRDAATETINEFARAHDIGGPMILKLTDIVNDFGAITGQKMPEAAATLAKAFDDPAKGASELQRIFNNQLDPSMVNHIIKEAQLGETLKAQNDLWQLLKDKVGGASDQTSFFGTVIDALGDKFNHAYPGVSRFLDTMKQIITLGPRMEEAMMKEADGETPEGDAAAAKKKEQIAQQNAALETALGIARQTNSEASKRNALEAELIKLKNGLTTGKAEGADRAQIVAREKEIQDQIANLKNQEVEREASDIASKRQMNQAYYSQQSEMIRTQHDLKQTTTQQEFAELKTALAQEAAAEQKSFDQEAALYSKNSTAFQKLMQQKQLAHQKYITDYLKLEKQLVDQSARDAQKQESAWKRSFSGVESSFRSSITGMITGTTTFQQAAQNVCSSIIGAFVDMGLKAVESWVMSMFETEASSKTSGLATIEADAAMAAAGAYAATAAIPIIGPALAPAAAGKAYAETIAWEGALAAESGAWDVKEGLFHLHDGETVLPKGQAETFRKNAADNALKDGGAKGGGDVHLHVHALDHKDVKRYLAGNGKHIANALKQHVRSGGSRASLART